MQYKLMKDRYTGLDSTDLVMRIVGPNEKSFVPNDEKNKDWREYQEWLAKGNVPLPSDSK